MSLTLIGCLEGCSSLKSLTLTLNECKEKAYSHLLREGLARNTSLLSLTLTINIYTEGAGYFYALHNISINSFTLTINDFSSRGYYSSQLRFLSRDCKSLTTFNLTLNIVAKKFGFCLHDVLGAVTKGNTLRTLRLKINDSQFRSGSLESDFSELVVKSPSLELIELTISRYGVVGSWLQTFKWQKQ